jgi:hypothetical protein
MKSSQEPSRFGLRALNTDRLGLTLILISSVLLGIWAVKDTIALRNILLVLGALGSIFFLYRSFRMGIINADGSKWIPIACIFFAIIWVVLHYFLFSITPESQLRELKSIWLRSSLGALLGFVSGIALMQYPRLISLFWLAFLLSFFILFAQYLPLALQSGQLIVPLDHTDFKRYLFIGKINPMYIGVLLIAGSTGFLLDSINLNDQRWIKRAGIFWLICLFIALYAFTFIVNTRSGIFLGGVIVFFWLMYGCVFMLRQRKNASLRESKSFRNFILILITALFLVSIFAKQQIQRDSGWKQLIEDINVGYQIEKYPHWQNHDLYGFPKTASGKIVTYNTYQRVAWATAGVKSIQQHPYGVGVLLLPLGLAAKELYPGVTPLSTHSGWVDLTLAFGLPFIFLMLLANGSLLFFAIKQKSPFKYTSITLSAILFALFLVGELSNGHNLEMLFFFFALMSGMLVAQKRVAGLSHSESFTQ